MSVAIDIPNFQKKTLTQPFWLTKIIRFEFWPSWVLYFPVAFYFLWLALKAKSLTFFTAANPMMHLGGLVGESKSQILKAIPPKYLPQTVYFDSKIGFEAIINLMKEHQLHFPIVIKPDVGERGNGVEKLNNTNDLKNYLAQYAGAFIIQSFITYPIELGILYYRIPGTSQSGITSIVSKEFLSITGDGVSTLSALMKRQERAQLRPKYLLNKFSNQLSEVIAEGETRILEPIGNHCRGTAFKDANFLITSQLVGVFDHISHQIKGFDIGRFDIKVSSIDELNRGEGIQIMELNGVTSEPAHIYDTHTSLWQAYKALFQHWKLVFTIAKRNNTLEVPYALFKTVLAELRKHYALD